jgi:Ser/Thr protein kinase RdoA (MazF antagonist)
VSDVFAPAIHENIEAVTRHLAAKGLRVAHLLRTRTGALSADLGALGRWRLMDHLGGVSFDQVQSVAQARSAGALVGRFHAAIADFDAPLAPMGIPYRDTSRYLAALRQALIDHPDHRLHAQTREVAERIFSAFESMGSPPRAPTRVIHGDLKLSNLLFEAGTPPGRDVAFALVDFDTLMRGTLWMELGDLWRSWCNSVGEDSTSPRFDLEIFAASCDGFARGFGAPLDPVELDSLAEAPERIILELAARFAADALEETYWGWDPERFPARGEHDIHRAVGQWRLYEATRATRSRRRELLRRLG